MSKKESLLKLQAIVDAWTDEIDNQVQGSDAAAEFYTKLEAYGEVFESMENAGNKVDYEVFLSVVLDLIAKTVGREVSTLREILRSKTRRGTKQTIEVSNLTIERQTLRQIFSRVKPRKQVKLDNLQRKWQSRLVSDAEEETPLKKLFRELIERAGENILVDFSNEQLDRMELEIKNARQLQAEQFLGLKPGQRLTKSKINRFLAEHANKPLTDGKMQSVTSLVQHFRNAGHELFLDEHSCVMTCKFSADRGHRRFVFRKPGMGGQQIAVKTQLPEGLHFK